MKKFVGIALMVLLIGAFVVSGCAPAPSPDPSPSPSPSPSPEPTPSGEKVNLTIAMWEGTEGAGSGPLRQLVQEWEEKSDGRITAEINYGAVMAPPGEHFDLAVTGVADVAWVQPQYSPGLFPSTEIVDLPVSGFTQEQMALALAEMYEMGWFHDDLDETHVLCFGAIGPYQLHMGKKVTVQSVSDLKNVKLRAGGGIHTEIVQRLGAVPVGMPAPEVYTSLDKGVIDGAYCPTDFIISFGTAPVLGSFTKIGIGGAMHTLVMNQDTYNNMPDDLRAIIDEVSPKYTPIFGAIHDEWDIEAMEALEEEGAPVYDLSDADMQTIAESLAPMWDEWISKSPERAEMAADFHGILTGMGIENPMVGYTP